MLYHPTPSSHNQNLPPRKNYSIKKHIKLASLAPSISPFPPSPSPSLSQPVSPFKPISNSQIPSHRFFNTPSKNTQHPPLKPLLPSIQHQKARLRRVESPVLDNNRFLLPVKESKSAELSLLNDECLYSDDSENVEGNGRRLEGGATIQLEQQQPQQSKTLRIKPMIIHNKLMAKFGMLKLRSQQQQSYKDCTGESSVGGTNSYCKFLKKKTFLNSDHDTLENPELFTFYPKTQGTLEEPQAQCKN